MIDEDIFSLGERPLIGRAWCPTPQALATLAEAGARPEPHPAVEVLERIPGPEAMQPKGVTDRKEKSANFAVIRLARMPAILTENLFVSNGDDAALLRDAAFIAAVAESHARGIARALQLPAKNAGDIVDVMTSGEVVELDAADLQAATAPVAGTKYYLDTTAGRLTATAPGAGVNGLYIGTTVEASRLVVRCGMFQG